MIDNNLVIGIICARAGSKGLPLKNLRMLDGEPLIARPIRHAIESGVIDHVVVSTDSAEIATAAKNAGATVPFLRPTELADDLATTESTIKHALLTYEELTGLHFQIGVHLTATDVFREPSWISDAVRLLISNPELESVFSGHRTHKNFWEEDGGNWTRLRPWMSSYSSRQIRKSVIREDTGLACASRAHLWRVGRRIGDKVQIIINDDSFTAIDIHTAEDLALAQAALNIRKDSYDH